MYIKKVKITFSIKFYNFDKFIDYISNNINNLNTSELTILNKLEQIYNTLYNDDIIIDSKLKKIIINSFNFKFKNRLQVDFWKERGYKNSNEIVSNIQKTNSEKVKNRFIPTSENLLSFGYDKETVKEWRGGPNMTKYWINKGYSEDNAKNMLSEYQRNLTKLIDYKNRISDTSIEYYINKGYSEKYSKELLSKRQNTINLDNYIDKYGEYEGNILYKERILNRNKYLGCSKKGYSDISQDLFNKLSKFYDNLDNILYAEINNEFKINKTNGYWLYDFTDIKNKKIIEFQGDRFHANPNIYNESEKPHPFLPVVKTCGNKECLYHRQDYTNNGKNNSKFTGHEEILGSKWSAYKAGAKKRNLEFNLDIKDAWELFIKQDKKCFFTGLDIFFGRTNTDFKNNTASLDRKDSSKGYTIDNVVWVHKKVNIMKMDLDIDEFLFFCNEISKNMKNQNYYEN